LINPETRKGYLTPTATYGTTAAVNTGSTGKIEHLRALIHLHPETRFERFLDLLQRFGFRDLVQVRQDAHDLWEPVNLQHIQELERFHFETHAAIDHQQHQVSDFRNVLQRQPAFLNEDANNEGKHTNAQSWNSNHLGIQ
jgi:hypothetical protein